MSGKASSQTSAPWMRFFPSEWFAATRTLRPAEAGIFMHLVAMMHERGEPIAEDHRRLATGCHATRPSFERALTVLIEQGIVHRDAGRLWSELVAKEVNYRKSKSEKAKLSAQERWEKGQQIQRNNDANATRDKSIESRGGALARSDPPESTDRSHHRSAPYGASEDEYDDDEIPF